MLNAIEKVKVYAYAYTYAYTKSLLALKGGEGSGNFGHEGRPGEVGGSAPSGEGGSGENEYIKEIYAAGITDKDISDMANYKNINDINAITQKHGSKLVKSYSGKGYEAYISGDRIGSYQNIKSAKENILLDIARYNNRVSELGHSPFYYGKNAG